LRHRQNIFGISLETDPDAIDVSAIITDAAQGVVAQAPPVYLGNRYTNGRHESFSPPKVIAETPISDSDSFPRSVHVTLTMAEKDDGGGFDHLIETVSQELAQQLGNEIGNRIDPELSENVYYQTVEREAGNLIKGLFSELLKALGLGDDPFRPVVLEREVRSLSDAPTGTQTVDIFEPNPAHHGQFRLTYSWHLSDHSGIATSTSGAQTISSTGAALTSSAARLAVPYPRPFRTFRFAAPRMKKSTGISVTTAKKPPPKGTTRPLWLYPMLVRPLGTRVRT
jgi:hypothetical protein